MLLNLFDTIIRQTVILICGNHTKQMMHKKVLWLSKMRIKKAEKYNISVGSKKAKSGAK